MKIVYCIIDCSKTGGTERIISVKANYLTDNLGYDVTIITTDQGQKPNFYTYSDKIKFLDLGINYAELKQYSFVKRIAEQIKKRKQHQYKLTNALKKINADIVIATYTHEFTLLPTIQDGSKKIAEIHFSKEYHQIERQYNKQSLASKLFSQIMEQRKHFFIDKYNKFIVLTKRDEKNWEKNHQNIRQIYNLLPFYPEESAALDAKKIISVGRLTNQKGYNLLIAAFRIVNLSYPDWQLNIFGDGEDKQALLDLIEKYRLETAITIHPPTKEIIKAYLEHSIYVMSSRYEGFPMVLLEAMSCGLPCVSFDCPCGPSEIIQNGEDGWIVENGNVSQLAEKIKWLIENVELRKGMGLNAKKNILRFAPDIIMKQWVVLFNEVVKK